MKKQILGALLAAIGLSSPAWAIDKADYATSISNGTKFIAQSDLTILANTKKVEIASGYVDRIFQTCVLFVNANAKERILKAGSILTVDHTEQVKSGTIYPDGYAAKIFFTNTELTAMKCFAGEPLSDNHKVPKFGDLEQAVSARFVITPGTATQIPTQNICK